MGRFGKLRDQILSSGAWRHHSSRTFSPLPLSGFILQIDEHHKEGEMVICNPDPASDSSGAQRKREQFSSTFDLANSEERLQLAHSVLGAHRLNQLIQCQSFNEYYEQNNTVLSLMKLVTSGGDEHKSIGCKCKIVP